MRANSGKKKQPTFISTRILRPFPVSFFFFFARYGFIRRTILFKKENFGLSLSPFLSLSLSLSVERPLSSLS